MRAKKEERTHSATNSFYNILFFYAYFNKPKRATYQVMSKSIISSSFKIINRACIISTVFGTHSTTSDYGYGINVYSEMSLPPTSGQRLNLLCPQL